MAATVPDRAAVVTEKQTLTYGGLDRASMTLARRLARSGVGAGDVVAVAVDRTPDVLIAKLGVLRAGGVYLPLDPALPEHRIEQMVRDADAAAIVASSTPTGAWATRRRLLVLEGGPDDAGGGASPALPRVDPRSLAYVIYTSGSTGTPKGVGVSHAAAVSHMLSINEAYRIGPLDRVAEYVSTSFDASIEHIVPPLGFGATIVLRGSELLAQVDLSRWLARHRVTFIHLPTSVWNRWALDPDSRSEPMPSLRMVGAGGEEMLSEAVAAWCRSPLVEVRLYNGYGPTEAVVTATRYEMPHPVTGRSMARSEGTRVPIGRPLPGRTAAVVDRRGCPVPIGVVGELLLGDFLADGYLGRPALTAERFVPAGGDLATPRGARVYRTGDLVRQRSDGALEYMGRMDRQVKVRGVRVELGEIETALVRHPAVAEGVVVARERGRGDRFLVAYLVRRDDAAAPSDRELAGFLEETLPAPLVPAVYVRMDALPVSPNGKIDRGALPVPEAPAEERIAPRNPVELALTDLWEELLETPVGVTDDFFALGGHSLLAVALSSRIGRRFGCRLPLSTLFQRPTIEGLAALLSEDGVDGAAETGTRVTLHGSGRGEPFFCVHPVGGTVFCYLSLARRLAAEAGGDRPFVALQATGKGASAETLEETAARYVDEVRVAQPDGPYLLGGWSYGGVVAYEMARQLEVEGETVGFLALIDSELPRPGAREPDRIETLLDLADEIEGLSGRDLGLDPEALRRMGIQRGLELLSRRVRAIGAVAANGSDGSLEDLAATRADNVSRLYRYRPGEYGGTLTLFRTEARVSESRWRSAAGPWGRLAATVDVLTVPGNHYSALGEPLVRELAAVLADRLRTLDG
jgi:amino acid adenylation domain-containing protein